MAKPNRGPGRPTVGKRVPLGLRVTPELKRRLDAAAEQSGRSQSQEAEFRLEHSFDHQDLLSEVLILEFGKGLAGCLLFLGAAMKLADSLRGTTGSYGEWGYDYYAYDQSVQAAVAVLEAMRPEYAEKPKTRPGKEDAGAQFADLLISAVRGDPDSLLDENEGLPLKIRGLLGPIASRMVKKKHAPDALGARREVAEDPAPGAKSNPFDLAIAVLTASVDLEVYAKRCGFPLDPEQVVRILEGWLKAFLVHDWDRMDRRHEGQFSPAGPEELEAKIVRRRV
jgi:hypothetical protein